MKSVKKYREETYVVTSVVHFSNLHEGLAFFDISAFSANFVFTNGIIEGL